ncbi:MAG: hypothetical protein IPI28_01265 [Candidatus Omnitrophica bacterium]|nr:hypothetical protein [Candidatus Omnitrophota bacterium]
MARSAVSTIHSGATVCAVEYLLGGVATEAADLLPKETTLSVDPPTEEGWLRQIDDFWQNL